MMSSGEEAQRDLIARGEALAQSDPALGQFIVHTAKATEPQDLRLLPTRVHEAILTQSYANLGQRPAEGHLIDIWTPETEGGPATQIIDVHVENMPFLVDSVLAAVRALGGSIQAIAHPILPVDAREAAWTVLEEPTEDSVLESFLHIHIDPLPEGAVEPMRAEIDAVLTDVERTVEGWRPMLEKLREVMQTCRANGAGVPSDVMAEALHFLGWLADDNFTFLGMREYRLASGEGEDKLEAVEDSGLGILSNPDFQFLRHGEDYVEMTGQHVAFLREQDPLMVTKANVRSRVHRRSHLDYVGVKLHSSDGQLLGELRILGLFTSLSFATPHSEVPLVRRKVAEVMRRSGLLPQSHSGKALAAALDNYPREELFQITEDQLLEFATLIAALADRPRVRVLPRIDRFDNFVSVLMFMPRDNYTSQIREKIGEYLAAQYDGRVSAYYPHFPEGELVRVHFIIGRNGGPTPRPPRAEIEAEVTAMAQSFGDRLASKAPEPGFVGEYRDAFSPGYQAQNSDEDALGDIEILRALTSEHGFAARFVAGDMLQPGENRLKMYHVGTRIPLSDRVPMLENFGFHVIDERSHRVRVGDGSDQYVHDMVITPADGSLFQEDRRGELLQDALLAVWNGEAENDGYNQLSLTAGLSWDEVGVVRALGHYLRQAGVSFSQHYIWAALANYPGVARNFLALFRAFHDPEFHTDRAVEEQRLREEISSALEEVTSLDEDRIIRRFVNLIDATLRTNYFQRDEDGSRRPALSIKFDPALVEGLPDPRPFREIFVYSARVEGVHLRFGSIARGGLRWSDRPEDFRTEVLGLAKAQRVKNAVIVPVGAKGGFVPKRMPVGADRDAAFAEGTACYKIFINALLDVTDNLDGDEVVYPPQVVRRDGDDPYLVVAADKGTATFSDTANAISEGRGYWLGDAFASGGSAGYDHKKMGITARGAWEAVKRHFQEMNRDIQSEPFTVVGVGDMSGDVFGNGMLLSEEIRLIAAFDHRDIFIDPDPDPARSFAERKRVFELGRSSWEDYDTSLISIGGGVYSRSLKAVPLSEQARKMLDIAQPNPTPGEVMTAILKAEADLLWFGGIGTYIRAPEETDAEVGDRANDAIRVTSAEVRAKVVGEGANLGVTQLGRIDFDQRGGRINSDAIDNSAGVNSSDLEVNIKIALGKLIRSGELEIAQRNSFLVKMTDQVAQLCLRNNYLQTLAISLVEREGVRGLPDQAAFMLGLEARGELNRVVEYLPDSEAVSERANRGENLSRPELAVLLAYAKNTLYEDLLTSSVPDDPYLSKELYRYFPDMLRQDFPETIDGHRLRREVIATVLSNAMINRGGPSYVHRMTEATAADPAQVALAYAAARDSYGLQALNEAIDKLDNKVDGEVQLALYEEVKRLLIEQTLWFLRNFTFEAGLSGVVERYKSDIGEISSALYGLLPEFVAQSVAHQGQGFIDGGTPEELARNIAELSALTLSSDIVLISERSGVEVVDVARAYFAVLERFNLGRITEQGRDITLPDRFDRMALDRAVANLMRAQRDLTADVLAAGDGKVEERLKDWYDARADEIDRVERMVRELTEGELTVSRLSVAAGVLSDLARA